MNEIALRDVKWHPKTNRICQIPKEGLEFAMLSPKYEQLNQLVWCKDFMQDLIWSYLNNQPIDIYGFKYDPKSAPVPSLKKLRLLVTNYKDPEFGDKLIKNVLPLIHSVEDRLKMPRTVLEKCHGTPATYKKSGVWILNASRRWLKATPMLSFYTLLVRIGFVHQFEDSLETTLNKVKEGKIKTYYDAHCRDKEMIEKALPGILKLMKYSDRKIFPANIRRNYPTHFADGKNSVKLSVFNVHDRCGVVGFSVGSTRQYFPHWHKYDRK
jgi:hypothetical protein